MRRHLTYANAAATLALVFAMTGGALAARHYLVNSTGQINPKVLRALRGATGPAGTSGTSGSRGVPGPAGAPGPEGRPGRDGRPAAPPALEWTPLALIEKWEGSEDGAPEFAKDAQGVVHLRGALDGAARMSPRLAVLPPGFRPATEDVWVRAAELNGRGEPGVANVQIKEGGEMDIEDAPGSDDTLVSLEGLSFIAG
jgi:Collagen triple helix repeat (20 copies)